MDNEPTILTVEDIDRVRQQLEDDGKQPLPVMNCTSCGEEMLVMLTDYYTGQCQECFYARKPWCSASPVREAYYMVDDAQ